MAKTPAFRKQLEDRATEPPTLETSTTETPVADVVLPASVETPPVVNESQTEAVKPHKILSIEVPLADVGYDSYAQRHIEVRMTASQARTLKRLTKALDENQSELIGGRRVITPPDAIRWLLEQIG